MKDKASDVATISRIGFTTDTGAGNAPDDTSFGYICVS